MKIILDTNVILSAFITEGLSYKVFEICIANHNLFISNWIIKETEEKLKNKFKVKQKEIDELVLFIKNNFTVLEPKGKLPTNCRDKEDNNLLLLAEFTKSDIIITGDKDLLILNKYKKTKILTPREFYQITS